MSINPSEIRNLALFFDQILDTNKNGLIDDNDELNKAILREMGIIDNNNKATGKKISKNSFIESFGDLSQSIKNLYEKFMQRNSQELEQNQPDDDFTNFTKNANEEFNNFKQEVTGEYKAFIETEEGKMLEFNNNNKNLLREFKIASMEKILKDLEQGYSGSLIATSKEEEYVITYDSEKKIYFLKSNTKIKEITEDKLKGILEIFADNAESISGRTKKVQNS